MDQMLTTASSKIVTRPRFEGQNIMTWIGFKHVMYLAEEAVIEHFRSSDLFPRNLFEEHGLCFEVVSARARILHALHFDDLVTIDVTPAAGSDRELSFDVTMHVNREDKPLKAFQGRMSVVFRRDTSLGFAPVTAEHPRLHPYSVERIQRPEAALRRVSLPSNGRDNDVAAMLRAQNGNCFVWQWHIPYFYCHYNERLQMSGYLRLMEEVEDLFLAARGISIFKMLKNQRWIPVVPTAQLDMLEEAYMEETLYTVYKVDEVTRDFTYTCTMDCFVERDGQLIRTVSGSITHGYAVIDNRRQWRLVKLDDASLAAIRAS